MKRQASCYQFDSPPRSPPPGGNRSVSFAFCSAAQRDASQDPSDAGDSRCGSDDGIGYARLLGQLRQDSQGEIVSVAALVAGLQNVAPAGDRRTIRKVIERSCNRCRARITDQGINSSGGSARLALGKEKLRPAFDDDSIGHDFRRAGIRCAR